MIATKDRVYVTENLQDPTTSPDSFSFQIPAHVRSMDLDISNNKLYWISSQDGVS